MVLVTTSILILIVALGLVSALHSAVSTIRGGAAASETVESQSVEETYSARLKTERLLIALRLAWGLIFSCILVLADGFPRDGLTAVLTTVVMDPHRAASLALAINTISVAVATMLLGDVLPGAYGADGNTVSLRTAQQLAVV